MTLIELLLAGGLLALLLTLTLSFLVPSLRASSRGALRVDLQQRANLALEAAVEDLQRCTPSSVWLFPDGMCLQRLDSFTSGGVQVWEPTLITYHWNSGDGRLTREVWLPGKPNLSITPVLEHPVAPNLADYQLLVSRSNGTEKLLADSVAKFGLSWASRAMHISLELTRQKERFELHRNVFLRNG